MVNGGGTAQRIRTEFFQRTLDSLRSHIAVLKGDGAIIAVNSPWKNFVSANGLAERLSGAGANYLDLCDQAVDAWSEEAPAVATGIREVVAKRRRYFYLEFPCHSPSEKRWFSVRITRFELCASLYIVAAHDDISQRKLAEFKAQEASRLVALQSVTDGLTGVANRRSFDRTLEQEWKRHERTQSPFSLAMLDVDCFKQYNDQYGHLAGDDCLKRVVQAIRSKLLRSGDFVARYGGEEFAAILPNTDTPGAAAVLKSALRSVRRLAISHPLSKVRRGIVTVSIGFATTMPGQHDSPSNFLHRVDQALYQAKANGRDQLQLFAPPNPATCCSWSSESVHSLTNVDGPPISGGPKNE